MKTKLIMACLCAVSLLSCSNNDSDDFNMSGQTPYDSDDLNMSEQALYVVAKQSADAPEAYQSEMKLFTLDDIRSFNPETGELRLNHVTLDVHLFWDIACRYRVGFYADGDLLFDALAVSHLSSAGWFDQLTFQTIGYPNTDTMDAYDNVFYIRYGYPGTIIGDTSVEQLRKQNANGEKRFIQILRQAHKLVGNTSLDYLP